MTQRSSWRHKEVKNLYTLQRHQPPGSQPGFVVVFVLCVCFVGVFVVQDDSILLHGFDAVLRRRVFKSINVRKAAWTYV